MLLVRAIFKCTFTRVKLFRCDFVITLLAFRPLLSKAVNRLPRIYNNKLKFPLCGFCLPPTLPMTHLASCLTLTGRPWFTLLTYVPLAVVILPFMHFFSSLVILNPGHTNFTVCMLNISSIFNRLHSTYTIPYWNLYGILSLVPFLIIPSAAASLLKQLFSHWCWQRQALAFLSPHLPHSYRLLVFSSALLNHLQSL